MLLWVSSLLVFLSWKPFGTPPTDIYNLALAVTLLIVIFITGLFNFYQEMETSHVLAGFSDLMPPTALVLRDGHLTEIEPSKIVTGDVIHLQSGCRVPADLRILRSLSLNMDKSMLTGESKGVVLTPDSVSATTSMLEAKNMAFCGCTILDGEGEGLVVATGPHTQLSKIAASIMSVRKRQSTLQTEINNFVKFIACGALTTALVMVFIWLFYLRVQHPLFMPLSNMLTNVIAIIVAFVPEGLPLALTMGLTIIASRLCQQYQVLVKELPTIETLGCMTCLCSDKTGTLTTNEMTVTHIITFSGSFSVFNNGLDQLRHTELFATILAVGCLCNQSTLEVPAPNPSSQNSLGKDVKRSHLQTRDRKAIVRQV